MGLIVFWSVLALFFFSLAIITGKARRDLKQELDVLEDRDAFGMMNKRGELVMPTTIIYKALLTMLITDVIGFVLTAAAAIASAVITAE